MMVLLLGAPSHISRVAALYSRQVEGFFLGFFYGPHSK